MKEVNFLYKIIILYTEQTSKIVQIILYYNRTVQYKYIFVLLLTGQCFAASAFTLSRGFLIYNCNK